MWENSQNTVDCIVIHTIPHTFYWSQFGQASITKLSFPSISAKNRINISPIIFVIAQFVARIKGYKIEGQTGVTGTNPTQYHHNGMVLSL
jgi:hypothetical protein